MPGRLTGRVALVTGASSGIGEGVALALAMAGATVALCARRADRLDALAGRVAAVGGQAFTLAGDLADEATATRAVETTVQRCGRLDILVNAAGVAAAGGVEHADTARWRQVLDINLLAALYTCKAAIGPMKAQGSGDIINISSTAGRRVGGAFGPYCTSKFGLTAMTEGLRQEVGGHGVRVCLIEPGATATEVAEGVGDAALGEAMRQRVGQDGAMTPGDVAAAILFVVTLPTRANVSEILIRPTGDTVPM